MKTESTWNSRGIFSLGLLFVLAVPGGDLPADNHAPPRCDDPDQLQSIYNMDWESGLGAWTAGTYSIGNPDTFDTPDWTVTDGLPDARTGSAAFVENLNIGDCALDDESGVLTLTGPVMLIPGEVTVPRISIDHWFQTEVDWDGGNIKISVNGGPFELLPSSAFVHASYTGILNPPTDDFGLIYNLNPLADQPAFTGTPDGGAMGSWLQSQIQLTGIAEGGDTVQLRLDFGIDDCNGEIGWYVDDLEMYACSLETELPVCGNAVLEAGEQCDDGNEQDGDGCSQFCQVEDGWSCTEPVAADEGSVCSLDATLTLVKAIVNDNGGGSVPSDWTLAASGPVEFSGRGPSVASPSDFLPGTYDLTESGGLSGYGASAWTCEGGTQVDSDTVTVGENEQVTCSITNDDIEPALTLVVNVVNDDGGEASASDWVLTASGPSGFSGAGPSVSDGPSFQAGTYTLSATGGPSGYIASSWSCAGGTQQGTNAVSIAVGEAASCTITQDDFDSDTTINVGHSGAWFNPDTSGQGVLIDVDPSSNFMFIAWFAYTADTSSNPFEQRWLTAQGEYSGNRAELVLYESLGGQFNDPAPVETLPIGSVTLAFGGCNDAQMSYVIDTEGLEGEFPLIRVIPGSEDVCEEQSGVAVEAVDINSGMDGGWFDPGTSGQGFLIDAKPDDVNGNFLFLAWFTYGDLNASGQWWLTAQGGFEGSTATLEIYETTGGSFNDPLLPNTVPVGDMQIDFSDCGTASLSYSIPDRTLQGEVDIIRLLPPADALCREISGTE